MITSYYNSAVKHEHQPRQLFIHYWRKKYNETKTSLLCVNFAFIPALIAIQVDDVRGIVKWVLGNIPPRKLPPGNIPPEKSPLEISPLGEFPPTHFPLVNSPLKIPPW